MIEKRGESATKLLDGLSRFRRRTSSALGSPYGSRLALGTAFRLKRPSTPGVVRRRTGARRVALEGPLQ